MKVDGREQRKKEGEGKKRGRKTEGERLNSSDWNTYANFYHPFLQSRRGERKRHLSLTSFTEGITVQVWEKIICAY